MIGVLRQIGKFPVPGSLASHISYNGIRIFGMRTIHRMIRHPPDWHVRPEITRAWIDLSKSVVSESHDHITRHVHSVQSPLSSSGTSAALSSWIQTLTLRLSPPHFKPI